MSDLIEKYFSLLENKRAPLNFSRDPISRAAKIYAIRGLLSVRIHLFMLVVSIVVGGVQSLYYQ